MVRQEPSVEVSAKIWHFLRGVSPRWVRLNQSPILSVAFTKEAKPRVELQRRQKPNDVDEAYIENHVDRKGDRTSLKQFSLVTSINAVGQGVMLPEAHTKEPLLVRLQRDCRGLRAWYVWREMSGTWEAPWVPAEPGRSCQRKRRHSGYSGGVRSSIVLRGGRAVHMGKETTILRSLQREHGPDKESWK